MKRKIYSELLKWKNENNNVKPLMLLGARQVGKTYIITEFCENEYEHFVSLNLFKNKEIVEINVNAIH